jgi:hypothetical protein
MKTLDLEKVWQVMNTLSGRELGLSEQNCYVSLLGNSSNYCQQEFDSFLSYYSFKVEDDNIVIFNDDGVPYESYTNQDFSYIPICLLSFSAEKIEKWIEEETEKQLKQQELNKIQEKEDIKRQIELLKKKLEN